MFIPLMFIPLEAADPNILTQIGGGGGILAVVYAVIREFLSYREKQRVKRAVIENGNGRVREGNPSNPDRKINGGSSTTNMLLDMVRENNEYTQKVSERLRQVEIGLASLQATCRTRHEKDV